MNVYLPSKQLSGRQLAFECSLYGLYLHGHSRQYSFLQTIELIKTAPGPALHQTNEDTTHGLDINTLEIPASG